MEASPVSKSPPHQAQTAGSPPAAWLSVQEE